MTESTTFVALAVLATALTIAASSPHADAPAGRYSTTSVSGTPAVQDTKTGLIWMQRELSGTYTWDNANKACPAGWRLPNIIELSSLLDRAKISVPTIDASFFQGPTGGAPTSTFFWSSSPLSSRINAWLVRFSTGGVNFSGVGDVFAVRCVK